MLPSICGREPHSSCDQGDGQPPLQTDVLVTDGEAGSAVSLSSCCKRHQLANPPFPHRRPCSLPLRVLQAAELTLGTISDGYQRSLICRH